jgi:hypothetical protein
VDVVSGVWKVIDHDVGSLHFRLLPTGVLCKLMKVAALVQANSCSYSMYLCHIVFYSRYLYHLDQPDALKQP